MSHARLGRELVDCQRDRESSGVFAETVGDSLTHLRGVVQGPEDSPYEGGVFEVDIRIPPGYPFEPPKMKFITRIWHPNISSQTGAICLDILKDQWTPALTVKTALLSLRALMTAAEPDDPQDAEVASMYKRSIAEFNRTARFWTESYAMPHRGPPAEAMRTLTAMGFSEDRVRAALAARGNDTDLALELLLSSG